MSRNSYLVGILKKCNWILWLELDETKDLMTFLPVTVKSNFHIWFSWCVNIYILIIPLPDTPKDLSINSKKNQDRCVVFIPAQIFGFTVRIRYWLWILHETQWLSFINIIKMFQQLGVKGVYCMCVWCIYCN